MDRDRAQLRKVIDGADSFMTGFAVGAPRTYARKLPAWTMDDSRVRALLERSFRWMHCNKAHRKQAGRWASIIYLYYRMGYTYKQLAEALGESAHRTRYALDDIRKAAIRHGYIRKPNEKREIDQF